MDSTLGRARLAQCSDSCNDVRTIPGHIIRHSVEEKWPSLPIGEEYFKHLKSIRLKIGGCFSSFLKAETVMENPRAVKPVLLLAGASPWGSQGDEIWEEARLRKL